MIIAEKDFSRYGRVNYVLAKRMELLEKVGKLKDSLNVQGDVAYTCETAGYFFLYQIQSRWEKYLDQVAGSSKKSTVPIDDLDKHFPFKKFFSDAPQPLFKGKSTDVNLTKFLQFMCTTVGQKI